MFSQKTDRLPQPLDRLSKAVVSKPFFGLRSYPNGEAAQPVSVSVDNRKLTDQDLNEMRRRLSPCHLPSWTVLPAKNKAQHG
jgi:hypothetical protein